MREKILATAAFESDQQLRRAQTFHIFRAEQEAWYLERQMWRAASRIANESERLSPRLVRLLAHPDRVKAFVECVATGSLAFDDERWVFHDHVKGNTLAASRNKSLMRAMTVFVLQRTEDRENSLADFDLASATESATTAAKAQGKRKRELVQHFIDNGSLDTLLQEHVLVPDNPAKTLRTRAGLKQIFRFYGDPEVKMEMGYRIL